MKPCLTLSEGFLPLLLSYAVSAVCKPWRLLQGHAFPEGGSLTPEHFLMFTWTGVLTTLSSFFFFLFFEVFSAHPKICIYTKYVFIARVCGV